MPRGQSFCNMALGRMTGRNARTATMPARMMLAKVYDRWLICKTQGSYVRFEKVAQIAGTTRPCFSGSAGVLEIFRGLARCCPGCHVPSKPYPSSCWIVQRLTSRRLASSLWLTPFDRSTRMYSRCYSVRVGLRLGQTALGPRVRLSCHRPLPDRVPPPVAEGEHHRELELAGGRRSVEVFRQGTGLHSRPVQALDHLRPAGQPCKRRR